MHALHSNQKVEMKLTVQNIFQEVWQCMRQHVWEAGLCTVWAESLNLEQHVPRRVELRITWP